MMQLKNKVKIKVNSTIIGTIALILLVGIFGMVNSSFLASNNIGNILTDISPLLTMAIGVTFIIMIGSTDLSIGAVCSMSSVLFVRYAELLGPGAYLLVIVFGLFSGLIVGLLHTQFKVPSFIASLGIMSVWQSLSLVFSNNGTIQLNPKQWYLTDWMGSKFGLLPIVFLISIIVAMVYLFLQTRTSFGKKVFTIGANERSAVMSGIPCARTKVLIFSLAGACYAAAGIMFVTKLASGSPNLGDDFTLLAIAAVALGGTSLSGGRGSVINTLIGVAIAMVIRNGMTVTGVDGFWQKIVFGSIIIIAAYMTTDRSNKEQVIK